MSDVLKMMVLIVFTSKRLIVQDILNRGYKYSDNLSGSLMGRFYNRLNITMLKNISFAHKKKIIYLILRHVSLILPW